MYYVLFTPEVDGYCRPLRVSRFVQSPQTLSQRYQTEKDRINPRCTRQSKLFPGLDLKPTYLHAVRYYRLVNLKNLKRCHAARAVGRARIKEVKSFQQIDCPYPKVQSTREYFPRPALHADHLHYHLHLVYWCRSLYRSNKCSSSASCNFLPPTLGERVLCTRRTAK
jgi:hypothetical protein